MRATRRYLTRNAEPTAAWASEGCERFARALVVPALGESPTFIDGLLEDVAGHDVLTILVVNETPETPEPLRRANARLLDEVGRRRWTQRNERALVVIDATSTGRTLPVGQGVGLARKLGFDLAVALWDAGRLRTPWIHTTDADARLGPGLFAPPEDEVVAQVFGFWHDTNTSDPTHRATALYELWLRYYAAGLRWATSPWGYVPLGSAMAVRADAYAACGGMPRRLGGEDFHLLAKLGKVGPIAQASAEVRLQARTSSRAPFGTGPGVAKIVASLERGETPRFYDPAVFSTLREALDALHHDRPVAHPAWDAIGGNARLGAALRSARTPPQRHRKLREWLDPLRTLRFVHEVENLERPRLRWPKAIEAAPFCPALGDVDALRHALKIPGGTRFGAPLELRHTVPQ